MLSNGFFGGYLYKKYRMEVSLSKGRRVCRGNDRRGKKDQEHTEKEGTDPPGAGRKERDLRHRDQRHRAERVVPYGEHAGRHCPGPRRIAVFPAGRKRNHLRPDAGRQAGAPGHRDPERRFPEPRIGSPGPAVPADDERPQARRDQRGGLRDPSRGGVFPRVEGRPGGRAGRPDLPAGGRGQPLLPRQHAVPVEKRSGPGNAAPDRLRLLTSRAAARHFTPFLGQSGKRPQAGHLGFRARQTRRPCQPRRVANSHRFASGTTAARSFSARAGSFDAVRPRRNDTLPTCVSTGSALAPKHATRRIEAVFLPTPGSAVSASIVAGTFPPCRSAIAAESPRIAFALFRKKPVGRTVSSTASGNAAASARGSGYLRNSAGVTWFTRSSVHWAASTVATSSSKGLRKSRRTLAAG